MEPGESTASNLDDMKRSNALLNNLVNDFGANKQALLPVMKALDAATGTNEYVSEQSSKIGTPDTSRVQSKEQIDGLGSGVSNRVQSNLSSGYQAAQEQPKGVVLGMNAGNLNEQQGRQQVVAANERGNEAFSSESRNALDYATNDMPAITKSGAERVVNPTQSLSHAQERNDRYLDKVYADPAKDFDGKTQSAMHDLKTDVLPQTKESFDAQNAESTKEERFKGALTQAVLHATVSDYGADAKGSFAESEKYRASINNEFGTNLSPQDIKMIGETARSVRSGPTDLNEVVDKFAAGSIKHSAIDTYMSADDTTSSTGRVSPSLVDEVVGKQMALNDKQGSSLYGYMKGAGDILADKTTLPFLDNSSDRLGDATNMHTFTGNYVESMTRLSDVTSALKQVEGNLSGVSEEKITALQNQKSFLERGLQEKLASDPSYGPEVAEKISSWESSLGSDVGRADAKESALTFLNENRKK